MMIERLKFALCLTAGPLFLGVFLWCGPSASAEPANLLADLEDAMVSLAESVQPAVVNLSPYVPPSPSVGRMDSPTGRATNAGAGVIFDAANGYVVTNRHVVRTADRVTVTLYGGEKLTGEVLGADEDTDLAVVRIKPNRPLNAVRFGDSSRLRVGQLVVAVGNPYGLNDTMTFGIISGLNRENVNLSRYEDFIQTDASINPGNSGGPLLNIRGEVIGINTAIINYAQSIGFAIPANMVKRIVNDLIEHGEVARGWLGVGIEEVTPEVAEQAKMKSEAGVLVNAVFEGDPAHRAGLKPGDIILRIGGAPVNSPSKMIRMIGVISPGQTVTIDILRDGKPQAVSVLLEKQKRLQEKVARKQPPEMLLQPLGIEVEEVPDSAGGGEAKLVVSKVFEHAGGGGLEPGDRILALNGETVASRMRYLELLDAISTGEEVFILIQRNEEKIHLALVRQN
jgi:serine protease Do